MRRMLSTLRLPVHSQFLAVRWSGCGRHLVRLLKEQKKSKCDDKFASSFSPVLVKAMIAAVNADDAVINVFK